MSNIDWSQMLTKEMREQRALDALKLAIQQEVAGYRQIADAAIAPLQDAVDIDEATPAEEALLKLWKKYRVELNRLPDQAGYPTDIQWPVQPV